MEKLIPPKGFKLAVGLSYRLHNNKVITINKYNHENTDYPFEASADGMCFTREGYYFMSKSEYSRNVKCAYVKANNTEVVEDVKPFKVNDMVVIVKSECSTSNVLDKYVGYTGRITKVDSSVVPFKAILAKDENGKDLLEPILHWFPTERLNHHDGLRIYAVDFLICHLMEGVEYYTVNGSVLKYKDGVFLFNKSKLNINKLHDLPLTTNYTVNMKRNKLETDINALIDGFNRKIGRDAIKSTFDKNTSIDELTRTYNLLNSL